MRLPSGPLDGAQPRDYVLGQLRHFGVEVVTIEAGWYELVDQNGDPEVVQLDDPVVAKMIIHLWRRFGQLHGMLPGDFVFKPVRH